MPFLEPVAKYSRKPRDEATMLRTLNAFAVDVMSIPTADDLFWYVAQNVVGQLGFIDCVIYRANSEQNELTQVAAMGEKNPYGRNIIDPMKIPFGEGITGKVAQTRKAIVIDDLATSPNYIPDTQPARSEICVPLVSRGRVVGVIDSEHSEPGAFGEADLEILITIAAMTSAKLELLAEALRSSQRYKDLVQSHAQLTEETQNRKELEARLYESRKLEAIGRLSGRFAHEFNNLLTVISGNLEFLEMGITDTESINSLGDAQTAAKRGAKLIEDMLAFSQRAHLNQEIIDLNRLVVSTGERSQSILTTPIDLEFTLAEDLWLVNVDPKATELALLNLIANARDASPEGASIQISTENVRHNLYDSQSLSGQLVPGRYVCLSVKDFGKGIPEDRVDQIFDPFFTTKKVGTGSGMGLSFVLGSMTQIGGAIDVKSKLHQGSTFRLFFPAVIDA